MSVDVVPAPGAAAEDPESDDHVPPSDVYWQLVRTNRRICPWCLRWQLRLDEIADGPIKVAGVEAEVEPESVAAVEKDHPPRVRRPSGTEDTDLVRYRACQPETRVCECGDIDGDPYQTLSREKALSLVPRLARLIGEFGYLYSLQRLHTEVAERKSDPDLAGDDDLVFELAVAIAIVDARGGDTEAVVEEILSQQRGGS